MDNTNIEKFKGFEVEIEIEDIIKDTSEELSVNIRNKARSKFNGRTAYADSWTFEAKKDKKDEFVGTVYNKDHYRLTHLLEKGHIVRNQYGRTKSKGRLRRVAPRPHIAPEFEAIKNTFIERMENAKVKIK